MDYLAHFVIGRVYYLRVPESNPDTDSNWNTTSYDYPYATASAKVPS
jgi:hypothetical protein